MTILTTVRDLRTWVQDRAGSDASGPEIDQMTAAIQGDASHPAWGDDWTDYLEAMPEYLLDVLERPE